MFPVTAFFIAVWIVLSLSLCYGEKVDAPLVCRFTWSIFLAFKGAPIKWRRRKPWTSLTWWTGQSLTRFPFFLRLLSAQFSRLPSVLGKFCCGSCSVSDRNGAIYLSLFLSSQKQNRTSPWCLFSSSSPMMSLFADMNVRIILQHVDQRSLKMTLADHVALFSCTGSVCDFAWVRGFWNCCVWHNFSLYLSLSCWLCFW